MTDPRLSACQGKALAVLLAVFVGGFASGAVSMRVYQGRLASAAAQQPSEMSSYAVDRLKSELNLSDEQVRRVQMILDESIMSEADLLARIKMLREEGRRQIMEVLNEQQKSRFESMMRQVSSR